MILTVCVGSLMPHMPELSVEVPDKPVHLLAYGSLTYWWGMLYPRTAPRWVFSGLFIVLGVTLEFAQRTTGYRTFDILDMVANAGGVLLGRLAVETPLAGLLAALGACRAFTRIAMAVVPETIAATYRQTPTP